MQEQLRRQVTPISDAFKSLEQNSAFGQIQKILKRDQDLMRAAKGPLDDLQRSALFDPSPKLAAEIEGMQKIAKKLELQFRLPKIGETTKLIGHYRNDSTSLALARFAEPSASLQKAIESMRSPWLDIENKLGSMKGFAELQTIGFALDTVPTFDAQLTEALRIDLGDWREKIDWPANIFTDPLLRSSFYKERGLDPSLTTFPIAAFEQSIDIAGLRGTPPPVIRAYTPQPEREETEENEAFERTNTAHDRLQRFEIHIRKFIDEKMKASFGENWIKHRVPGNIWQAWREKQQKATDNAEPAHPLIAYADFTDYVPIITRKDNWETLFKPIFLRQSFVQESFQRLYPIRICTMHARLITQDDELYLYVETKRILSAIGVSI
ncbi:MAG: hypothetical protein HPY30_00975 [Gammaproteobacteria bacterium (ex Lamellibrachia satsuma)]|nr:MAG: hypothetical protein HPY30_00975 [Gammaproteobacteria bacterium (ex Lamellibrachia satsuma)]